MGGRESLCSGAGFHDNEAWDVVDVNAAIGTLFRRRSKTTRVTGNRVNLYANLRFILDFVFRPRSPARSQCTVQGVVRTLPVMEISGFLLPSLIALPLGIEDTQHVEDGVAKDTIKFISPMNECRGLL